MLSKRIILQIIIFYTITTFGQSYKLFNTSRNFWSKNFCEKNPPTGTQYTTLNSISVNYGLKGDGSTLYVDDSNGISMPDEYHYNLEDMLLGIVGTDNVLGYPEPVLLDISNICYYDFIHFLTISPSYFKTELTTATTENNGDNSTGSEVTLSATPGYHPLVYTWQYYVDFTPEEKKLFPENATIATKNKINGTFNPYDKGDFSTSSNWRNFPNQLLGKEKVTFTAKDLFGKYANLFVGRSIKFRIRMSNGWISDEIFSFVFIDSSPQLRLLTPHETKCNYTEDGSFTFTVGRNLIESENEKMIATLYYEFTSNNYDVAENGQEEITNLIDNKNGTYSYTWKGGLPPGNYKLKYQTYNGTGGISPDDSSWDDLRFSEIFEIKAPLNIIFEAERFSDENCVKSGDGKIRVFNVSGGTGEGYEYELNESTDWIPFSSSNIKANEVIIGGRVKGTYKVKVRDSKKCIAK